MPHRRSYVQHSCLAVDEKTSSFLPCAALQVAVGEKGFNYLVALNNPKFGSDFNERMSHSKISCYP